MKKLNPKNDEILGNSIKQITHQGGKEGKKTKGPKSEPKEQNQEWITKRPQNKSCPKAPNNHNKPIRKKKDRKLEITINLEKPSFATMACFKIETT
jgi:hypothetical protein